MPPFRNLAILSPDPILVRQFALCLFALTAAVTVGERAFADAGMTKQEIEICTDLECKNLIAPCSLKERNANGSLNYMDEMYLYQMQQLTERGFCARAPRALDAATYSKSTCFYLFVKAENCQ